MPSTGKQQPTSGGAGTWGFSRQDVAAGPPAKDPRAGTVNSAVVAGADYGAIGDGQKRPHTAHGGRGGPMAQPANTASDLRKPPGGGGPSSTAGADQDEVLIENYLQAIQFPYVSLHLCFVVSFVIRKERLMWLQERAQ